MKGTFLAAGGAAPGWSQRTGSKDPRSEERAEAGESLSPHADSSACRTAPSSLQIPGAAGSFRPRPQGRSIPQTVALTSLSTTRPHQSRWRQEPQRPEDNRAHHCPHGPASVGPAGSGVCPDPLPLDVLLPRGSHRHGGPGRSWEGQERGHPLPQRRRSR